MSPEQEAALAAVRARMAQGAARFTPEQAAILERARARLAATQQPDFPTPEPPPGAIIHGADGRSTVAGAPGVSVARTAAPGSRDEAIQMQALAARGRTDGGMNDAARMARPFTQGQSFNLGDELVSTLFGAGSAATSGTFGDAYDYAQEVQRQELERQRTEAPITSTLTELGGGIATGFAAAPKLFSSGAGLLGNTVIGTAAGAAGGAVAGVGGGSGLNDRLSDALTGAGIGAGLTLAAPLAGAAVGGAVRSIGASRAAAKALEPVGIGRRAGDQIGVELSRDSLTPEAAKASLDTMGPAAMLLDAGTNIGSGAEMVANMPGAGNKLLRERLAARNSEAPQRITAAADTALGPQRNVAETVDELIARRNAEAGPLYDKALGEPVTWTPRLQQFIDEPVVRDGLKTGVDIQRLDALAKNEPFNPLDYSITGFDEAGEPIITGIPNMRTLNVAKKGLDATIEGYRDPTSGRLALDERGRAINSVQRAFLDELDSTNPTYAQARAAYAGPTRVRDALSLGQDVFNPSVRPDQLRQRLATMSPDEREAFTMGARDQLSEVMGTARRDAGAARAMFEKGWNREKLGLVLGDDQRAGDFLDTLANETAFANRSGNITGNSATFRREERRAEYGGSQSNARRGVDPTSGFWGDIKRVGAGLFDSVIDGRNARSAEQMRNEIGDAVSRQGDGRSAILDALKGYGDAKARSGANGDRFEGFIRSMIASLNPTAVNYATKNKTGANEPSER